MVSQPVSSSSQPTIADRVLADNSATVTDREFAGRNSLFQTHSQTELCEEGMNVLELGQCWPVLESFQLDRIHLYSSRVEDHSKIVYLSRFTFPSALLSLMPTHSVHSADYTVLLH